MHSHQPSFCVVGAFLLFLIFINIKSSCCEIKVSLVVQICGYLVTYKHSNRNRNVAALIHQDHPKRGPLPRPPVLWEGNGCHAQEGFSFQINLGNSRLNYSPKGFILSNCKTARGFTLLIYIVNFWVKHQTQHFPHICYNETLFRIQHPVELEFQGSVTEVGNNSRINVNEFPSKSCGYIV